MTKYCFVLFLYLILSLPAFSQIEKGSVQAGISALPVSDALKMFPKNAISGLAVIANLGYFPAKNLALGISPYYAMVSNEYPYRFNSSYDRKKEEITLFGMNIYARYYFLSQKRLSLYPSVAAGFGNLLIKEYINGLRFTNRTAPAVSFRAGMGLSCSLNEMISLELDASYLYLRSVSADAIVFRTFAPTVGIQFFFR